MNKNFMIGAVLVLVLFLGGFYILNSQNQKPTKKDAVMEKKSGENMMEKEGMKKEGYAGAVLAGKPSPYLVFTKADYDKAKAEGKIIYLDFFANWCPICRAEAPQIKAAFDSLTTDKVVGFRVNYNDSDTDENEKDLAREFGVSYQHTKVILKDGKQILKETEEWDKERILKEINAAL